MKSNSVPAGFRYLRSIEPLTFRYLPVPPVTARVLSLES
jgi:hypothetical protein